MQGNQSRTSDADFAVQIGGRGSSLSGWARLVGTHGELEPSAHTRGVALQRCSKQGGCLDPFPLLCLAQTARSDKLGQRPRLRSQSAAAHRSVLRGRAIDERDWQQPGRWCDRQQGNEGTHLRPQRVMNFGRIANESVKIQQLGKSKK